MFRKDRATLWWMLSPYLFGVGLLIAAPAAVTLAMAFFRYDALSPPEWRGFGNFSDLFKNSLFWTAARNSALFVLLAVPLRLLGALALALALSPKHPRAGLHRMAVFFPTVIPDVAYALLWMWLFNPLYGPLNIILHGLGLPAPAWLADGKTALFAMVIMSVFQAGEGFVVLLAGLQSIPEEVVQSAVLDGSSRWQVFRWVTLPLLSPWLLLLTLRDVILSAQNTFAPAYLMTEGGPYYATLFLPLLIYEEAFSSLRLGSAAAIMLMLLVAVALLLALVFFVVRGWGYADEV